MTVLGRSAIGVHALAGFVGPYETPFVEIASVITTTSAVTVASPERDRDIASALSGASAVTVASPERDRNIASTIAAVSAITSNTELFFIQQLLKGRVTIYSALDGRMSAMPVLLGDTKLSVGILAGNETEGQ